MCAIRESRLCCLIKIFLAWFWFPGLKIRATDCWLALPLVRNVTGGALLGFHSLHDSYSGSHLHIVVVVVFQPPSAPLAEKQTHATNYSADSLMVGVHGGIWGGKMKQAQWGWVCRGDAVGGGVPPVMRMSHRPHGGFWHQSGLIRGGQQFPTNVLHSWWMREAAGGIQHNKLCITSLRRLAACCQDLRCVVILKEGGRCVCVRRCVRVYQCDGQWE